MGWSTKMVLIFWVGLPSLVTAMIEYFVMNLMAKLQSRNQHSLTSLSALSASRVRAVTTEFWFCFCRKGQSSWSDANTRCQNEGDVSLAKITLVKYTSSLAISITVSLRIKLNCSSVHVKERKWEHRGADGGDWCFWEGLHRTHWFCHRGAQCTSIT